VLWLCGCVSLQDVLSPNAYILRVGSIWAFTRPRPSTPASFRDIVPFLVALPIPLVPRRSMILMLRSTRPRRSPTSTLAGGSHRSVGDIGLSNVVWTTIALSVTRQVSFNQGLEIQAFCD
jgi:hypothetical protein